MKLKFFTNTPSPLPSVDRVGFLDQGGAAVFASREHVKEEGIKSGVFHGSLSGLVSFCDV